MICEGGQHDPPSFILEHFSVQEVRMGNVEGNTCQETHTPATREWYITGLTCGEGSDPDILRISG